MIHDILNHLYITLFPPYDECPKPSPVTLGEWWSLPGAIGQSGWFPRHCVDWISSSPQSALDPGFR